MAVRLGLIGTGAIAGLHISEIRKYGEFDVVAGRYVGRRITVQIRSNQVPGFGFRIRLRGVVAAAGQQEQADEHQYGGYADVAHHFPLSSIPLAAYEKPHRESSPSTRAPHGSHGVQETDPENEPFDIGL